MALKKETRYIVDVHRWQIDHAIPCDCGRCPISLSLMYNSQIIATWVDTEKILLKTLDGHYYTTRTPFNVQQFIIASHKERSDNGTFSVLKPFTFLLDPCEITKSDIDSHKPDDFLQDKWDNYWIHGDVMWFNQVVEAHAV